MMVGLFAVSEVLRYVTSIERPLHLAQEKIGNIFKGQWTLVKRYPVQALRGSALGTLIGALPGAGADIAAWMSYAMSKKFSKQPEKFGTGHVEGVIESGAANNSALSGAWIPALVFGIPGDSITAIAIGVLYLKNMNPGPTIFINNPENIYAVFIVFFLANLMMLPLGVLAIKSYKQVLQVSRCGTDAGDPGVLHGRRVCDQQHALRHRRHAGIRRAGVRASRRTAFRSRP